jgi:ketosteroid isomerase-like protein
MSIEDNKRLVRRYFEDAPFNPAACDEIFAVRFQFHTIMHASITPPTVESDPESEKVAFENQKRSMGGWNITIEDMIAEGDRVMVRWSSRGTHQGELAGLPPTSKQVTNSGINIFRIANDRIAEVWDIMDRMWLWQQLGVLPELKEAIAKTREVMLLSQQGGRPE